MSANVLELSDGKASLDLGIAEMLEMITAKTRYFKVITACSFLSQEEYGTIKCRPLKQMELGALIACANYNAPLHVLLTSHLFRNVPLQSRWWSQIKLRLTFAVAIFLVPKNQIEDCCLWLLDLVADKFWTHTIISDSQKRLK